MVRANYCDRSFVFLFFFFFLLFFVLNHIDLFNEPRRASSLSSTHPAIEISTPRDYHHFSKLHPPL